jgi:hypothetical protein
LLSPAASAMLAALRESAADGCGARFDAAASKAAD